MLLHVITHCMRVRGAAWNGFRATARIFIMLSFLSGTGCYIGNKTKSECRKEMMDGALLGIVYSTDAQDPAEEERIQSNLQLLVAGLAICDTLCSKTRLPDGELVCSSQ